MFKLRAPVSMFTSASNMLSALFLIGTGLIASTTAHAEDCQVEYITLTNQTQVDNFQSDYGSCDTITGGLGLQNGTFTNLDGLSDIVTIVGNLSFAHTASGTAGSLSGLTSLTSLVRLGIAGMLVR